MQSSTRPNSKKNQRRSQSQQGQPNAQVIKRQNVSLELIEGEQSSTVNVDVRLAIKTNMNPPQMVVAMTHRDRTIAMLCLPEPPNVLNLFRLYEFVTRIRKINVAETELLSQAIHEGALPQGRPFKRFRKNVGQAFEFALSFVPSEKDVLVMLAHCHEFDIKVDTESLTALAAEGHFTVTSKLEESGVMSPVAYRERRVKIDQRIAVLRPMIEQFAGQFESIPVDGMLTGLRPHLEYGISDDAVVFMAALSIAHAVMPSLSIALTPNGIAFLAPDVFGSAKQLVKTADGDWSERRILAARREYMGYVEHRRSGAVPLETGEL